jgi:hypothetical protein
MTVQMGEVQSKCDDPAVGRSGHASAANGNGEEIVMCKRLLPALLAFFLLASPAVAQSPPSDELVAARELIATMRAIDQYKAIMPGIFQALKPAIVQNRPEVARDFDELMPILLQAMIPRLNELAELTATVYAANFTASELRELTAFYRTPTGEKFLQKMPVVTQQSMAVGQKFGQEIAAEMRNRMTEELRKRGHNI